MSVDHPKYRMFFLLGIVTAILILPGQSNGQSRDLLEPDVMLLIDSSGSMDWRDDTNRPDGLGQWDWARQACEADKYSPDARTSWQKLQDAFLGKFNSANYRCAVHQPVQRPSLHALRDENISDYVPDNITEFRDVSYPHFHSLSCSSEMWQGDKDDDFDQCIDSSLAVTLADGITHCYADDDNLYEGYCLNLHPESDPRQNNGILDTFGSNVRFGAMTYDNLPKCWGSECAGNRHATRWDYGHYRNWNCGGIDNATSSESGIGDVCYDWNAGARGGSGEGYAGAVGGLVGIGQDAESSNDDVADLLESMEPLFCSPLGALIDDAGYYFANEPSVTPNNDFNESIGEDRYYRCRPKIALLITDGQPTDVFEFSAGTCTDDGLAKWDPINANVVGRIAHDDSIGPPFLANPDEPSSSPPADTDVFDCPWRSSPEEAAEIFDVGARALQVDDATKCVPNSSTPGLISDCWPLVLVVVGFNVPDDDEIDCVNEPETCYYYDPTKYDLCWKGLVDSRNACIGESDAGDIEEGTLCPMTPRQFLNEVACQGWPYDTLTTLSNNYVSGGEVTHKTEFVPPWLAGDNDFCADNDICMRADDGSWVERALFVNDVDELAAVLDLILVEMASNVVTRTDVVTWNVPTVTGFDADTVAQYEFRSGYVAKAGRPWKGVLTREDKTCSDDADNTVHNVSDYIEDQNDDRTIYSYYSNDQSYSQAEPALDTLANWLDQSVIQSGLQEITSGEFNDCAFGVGDYVGSQTVCEDQSGIADLIVQETLTRGLADIFNSTPAILGPPRDRIASASYNLYRTEDSAINSSRHPFMFVATNDGVLHAIDVDEISNGVGSSPEYWGFIPKSILKELFSIYPIPKIEPIITDEEVTGYSVDTNTGTGLYRHQFLMDGAPVARDVLLIRRSDEHDPTNEKDAWRAIVFGNSGKNSRTHYALDVTKSIRDTTTAPKPELRYEINPDFEMYGNNNTDGEAALDELGMPMSKPALAYVRETINSQGYVEAAALIPGGYKADPDPNAADPKQDGNTGLYVLRLADGKVIRYLDPQDDICPNSPGLLYSEAANVKTYWDGAQLVGEPVVPHGTRALSVTTHAYVGDDRGRIWLVDMYDSDPDDWCLSLYFDTLISWHYPYEDCVDTDVNPCDKEDSCLWTDCCKENDSQLPCDYLARNMMAPRAYIIGAPSISVNEENEDVLVFGTGQYDELTKWNRNRVFSLTDKATYDVTRNEDDEVISRRMIHTPTINWWIGDSVPSGDAFTGIPSGRTATLLDEIEDAMRDSLGEETGNNITRINLDDFPVATTQGTDDGPRDFWNVGEKLIGRPVVFDQTVYFTTFVPIRDKTDTKDACDDGASRVWALDYDTYDPDALNTDSNYIGKFKDADGKWIPFLNYNKEVLSGVKVVKKPRCTGDSSDLFELVVQKANTDVDTSQSGAPPVNAVEREAINIQKRSDTSVVSVRFDSWSIVF